MKRKLVSLSLVLLALCLMIPSVFANAQISHDRETSTEIEIIENTITLDPEYYPYTQAEVTITTTGTIRTMYYQATDANGVLHVNGKALVRGSLSMEAWLWDDLRQVWVLGQTTSQSSKMFVALNEISLDSEVQNSQETRLLEDRIKTTGIDPLTGEPISVNILLIEHVIIKLVDGELQFEKSWSIKHGS